MLNEVWLELSLAAQNLIAGTSPLALAGELARAEPKRLRYRLFHQAGADRPLGAQDAAAARALVAVGGRDRERVSAHRSLPRRRPER